MTYTHIVCTNSKGLRVIQPFNGNLLSFAEDQDGGAVAYYYTAGQPRADDIQEKFSVILGAMISAGVAIDCTKKRSWEFQQAHVEPMQNPNYGGAALAEGRFQSLFAEDGRVISEDDFRTSEIRSRYANQEMAIKNLKKNLDAKDDENIELKKTMQNYIIAQNIAHDELSKMGMRVTSFEPLKDKIARIADQVWVAKSRIKQLEKELADQRSKEIAQESETNVLSDESQGIIEKGNMFPTTSD